MILLLKPVPGLKEALINSVLSLISPDNRAAAQ